MDACIASMYIPGLESAITAHQCNALLRINTPNHDIKVVEIYFRYERLRFMLLTSKDFDDGVFLNMEIQVSTGKTFTSRDFNHEMVTLTPKSFLRLRSLNFWKLICIGKSMEFTPFFDSGPTRHAILNIDNVDEADVSELIMAVFEILGLIRDDVDTKPARPS